MDVNPIKSVTKTDEGFIKLWLGISDANNPLVYLSDNGVIVENIEENELFSKDSLDTLVGKPITCNHPDIQYVTPENIKKYQVGTILQETKNNNGVLEVAAIITDSETIANIDKKLLSYTSAAYHADKDIVNNNFKKQKNRKYNHVALLTNEQIPRAGIKSRIILDSFNNMNYNVDVETTVDINPTTTNIPPVTEPTNTQSIELHTIIQLIEKVNQRIDEITQVKSVPSEPVQAFNTDEMSERVKIFSNYEKIIKDKSNNKLDYNLDSSELKRIVLSTCLNEIELAELNNHDKISGAFTVFEKLSNNTMKSGKINEDSFTLINPTTSKSSRDKFIQNLLGDK